MQTSVCVGRGGMWLSLWKAFASTVAETPGDNALHTDAFQDVDSKAVVVGCFYQRMRVSEPQFPTGCYLGSTRLRSFQSCFREMPPPSCSLHVSPSTAAFWGWRQGICISDNGRNNWASNPPFLLQRNPTWEKGPPVTSKPWHVRTPCWEGDVPPLNPCSDRRLLCWQKLCTAWQAQSRGLWPGFGWGTTAEAQVPGDGADDPEMRGHTQSCVTSRGVLRIHWKYRGLWSLVASKEILEHWLCAE